MEKTSKKYLINLVATAVLLSSLTGFLFKGWGLRATLNGWVHICLAVAILKYGKKMGDIPFYEVGKSTLNSLTYIGLAAAAGIHYVADSVITSAVAYLFRHAILPENILRLLAFGCICLVLGLGVKLFSRASGYEAKLKKEMSAC